MEVRLGFGRSWLRTTVAEARRRARHAWRNMVSYWYRITASRPEVQSKSLGLVFSNRMFDLF